MKMAILTHDANATQSEKAAEEATSTYWQIGLKAHQNDPDQPAAAIKNIWDAMSPADLTRGMLEGA
jgi:hypothetical protein